MKKYLILLIAFIFLLPIFGFSNAVSFKIGYFFPRANSELWDIEFENMNFTLSNYQNSVFGFAYEHFLTREISVVFGIDGYNRNRAGYYRDYVGLSFEEGDFAFPEKYYNGDFTISHAFNVSITPIQVSVKLLPLGRRGGLTPYVGGGVGFYLWTVRLQGDMVDFDDIWTYEDPDLGDVEIYAVTAIDAREENKFKVGYHVFGGFMYPVGARIAIEAEFKYNFVKAKFTEAFLDFDPFDLSGYQISIGLNYWF